MPLTGLYVIVAGIVIAFLAFLFAIVNMGRGFLGEGVDMRSMFAGHLGSMAGMAIGGFVAFLGVIWLIIDAVSFYG